ncbi:MAG TPA: hypothetical protein VJB69_01520 [Candidatus Paceibacterota bacterium]
MKIKQSFQFFLPLFLLVTLIVVPFARADEYTASSFRVLDPVLALSGFSSSTDFQLFGSFDELAALCYSFRRSVAVLAALVLRQS